VVLNSSRAIGAAFRLLSEPGRFTKSRASCGIASTDGAEIVSHRAMGLVSDALSPEVLARLRNRIAIGHVRYSTTGGSRLENAQPFVAGYAEGQIAIAHNGNLSNGLMFDDVTLTSKQPLDRDYRMYTHAVRDGVDFNVASIPDDFTEVSQSTFDQDYMTKLYKRGYEAATSGTAWQKTPPDYVQ
jgi:hypothetical protein